MAVVGSAEIVVRAITNQVSKDIKKAFKDARPLVGKEGEKAGQAYADGFNRGMGSSIGDTLRASMRSALSDITNDMQQAIPNAARQAGADAGNQLDQTLGRSGGSGGRSAGRNAASGFGTAFTQSLKGLSGLILNAASAFDILGPAIFNVIGAVSSLVSGLFAVVSAAGQAAGALAVLPGLLGVLAQSLGAVKFGFAGVGEAVKLGGASAEAAAAATTASTAATTAAAAATAKQQKATEAATKANEELKRSRDEVTNAEKLYEMTQRDLARVQATNLEGTKSQAAAEFFLADAKKRRDAVVADSSASSGQGAAAQKEFYDDKFALKKNEDLRAASAARVQKAEEKNNAARQRLSAALRARQAAADKADKAKGAAQKARIEPVPIITPAQAAANAYADALAKLTPEAQAFVKEVLNIKERFSEVSDVVASNLLPPLTEALQLLQSDDVAFFDILKSELGETGRIVGGIGLQITKAFTTDANMDLFQKYLDGNNKILGTFSESVDGGKSPVESLVSVLLKLGNAIQPVTEKFARFIGQALVDFDSNNSVQSLTKFFDKAGRRAALLGDIIGNLFGILGGLGRAAEGSGKSLLVSFRDATAELDKFIKRPKQQKELKEFFEGVETNFRAISDLIKDVGFGFLKLGDNPGIAAMILALEGAKTAIGNVFEDFTDEKTGTAIGEFGTSLAELIEKFAQSGATITFLKTLTGIFDAIKNGIEFVVDANEKFSNFINDVTGFFGADTSVNVGKTIITLLAGFRAFRLFAKVIGFGPLFNKLTSSIFKLAGKPFKALGSSIGSALKKLRALAATKIKSIFGGGTTPTPTPTPTPDPNATPGGASDAQRSNANGEAVGRAFNDGVADGIRATQIQVETAIDTMLIKIKNEYAATVKVLGREIGDDLVDGIVLGINTNAPKAVAAIRKLGTDVILALKKVLGIASPSKITASIGEDTGEGFVIGVRSEATNAFAAGRTLGQQAAAGARAGAAGAAGAGAAAGRVVAPAAAAAAVPAARVAPAAAAGASAAAANTSRLGRVAGPVTKSLGGLTKGLGALSAGLIGVSLPVLAIIAALVLVFFALKRLYSQSPEFKKFVDGVVDKFKELGAFVVKIFDEFIAPALSDFFGFVNKNLPKVASFFGDVFGKIKEIVVNVFVPIFNDFVLPAIQSVIGFVQRNMPLFQRIFETVFKAIKGYVTNILIPGYKLIWEGIKKAIDIAVPIIKTLAKIFVVVFKVIKGIITNIFIPIIKAIVEIVKALLPVFQTVFNTVKTVIKGVFEGIKFVWENVLKPVFNGIKTVITTVFDIVGGIFDGFKRAFEKVGDTVSAIGGAIGDVFNTIKSAAKAPIEFIVNTLWNNGLLKVVNAIPGVDLPEVPGFASGGYTGSGGKYDVAGLVHRDEYVIQKSSRRVLEQMYPGLLDFINKTGKLPNGHSSGGVVRSSAYTGAVAPTLRGLPGYRDGNAVTNFFGGVKDKVKGAAGSVKDTVNAIKDMVEFLKSLPNKIAEGLSATEFGRLISAFPKGVANKLVGFVNGAIPNFLPGVSDNPFGQPFPGVEFRALGGRVRAGSPYVVGELRPELFVPDRNGTIVPNLNKIGREGGSTTVNTGPGFQMNIGKVEAHDYQDFMMQMQKRKRSQAMSGFTLPTRGKK